LTNLPKCDTISPRGENKMTVRIIYSKPCEMVCEVSDNFNVLSAEGGFGSLSREVRYYLQDELTRVAETIIGDECVLHSVETLDEDVLVSYV
jgi:hypothetical protein